MAWFPLYHGDYLRDTSDLSPSEHGIYLLLLMAFFGRGPLPDHITRLCRTAAGADPEEVRGILERYWERTPSGWINRRMEIVRSEQQNKHERRVKAGKQGGQIKASNARAMLEQCSSNQNQNQTLSSKEIVRDPEAKKRKTKTATPDPDFERFWAAYPRKISKAAAVKAWAAATITPDIAALIVADVTRRRIDDQQWQDPRYIPHASTYLNQRRWEDEILTVQSAAPIPKTREQWVKWGEENGHRPRPGEGWDEFIARVRKVYERKTREAGLVRLSDADYEANLLQHGIVR